jgi:hypothetical protein
VSREPETHGATDQSRFLPTSLRTLPPDEEFDVPRLSIQPATLGFCAILWMLTLAPCPVTAAMTLYVASTGNDSWSGKISAPNATQSDGPLATLQRARDTIRKIKTTTGLPPGGIVVEVAAGRYELAAPLELTAEDSGTPQSPIVYRARPGDVVRLSGGRIVTDWQPVTDPAVLDRLDPAARGQVFQADLKALGISEYGDLGLDAAWELQYYLSKIDNQGEDAMGSTYASVGKKVHPRLEVFFNDEPMELSRWPNEGFIKVEQVLGKTPFDVRGVKGCKEGIFVYEGDRPKRWVGEKDAWVEGYWCRDWAEQRHKIRSLDTEKHVISVEPPYHTYGYRKGQWFRGFNLLCEIDTAGEWYIDREMGILYFWPPKPIDQGRVEVSMAPSLFTLNDVSHVTIRGLLMEAARSTAITITDGQQCRVVGCTFRNLGNHAVTVFNGHEHGVVGCDMYGMGGGGIYLVGGDRKTLMAAGHFAENNHIHHFGRWDRMYRPGIFLSGVGLRASHNLIHDAPHSAILFGGNDHLFEYNEIHSVCYESHDCGAIYAGRSWTLRGHVLQYNYLHHLCGKDGGPCNGIYLDDLFSSATVQGNVFYQVMRPVFIGGGRDNIVENNVFVDCPKALHVDARALGWCGPHADGRIQEAREKGTLAGVRYREPPFSTRYPQLFNILDEDPKSPRGNIVRRNVFWAGHGENIRRVQHGEPPKDTWWDGIEAKIRPLVKLEDNLIHEDPKFVDEKVGNFQLRAESPAWKLGFQRIPVEKIGLYKDDRRASWPVTHPVRPMPEPAVTPSFIKVSARDRRYFETADGKPYIPIGLNMVDAPYVRSNDPAARLAVLDQWLTKLAANGGNHIRVWLSSSFYEVEQHRAGEYDPEQFRHIDAMLQLCQKHGIRVKLTVEHFREIDPAQKGKTWAMKTLHHTSAGGTADSMAQWLASTDSRKQYIGKLEAFAQRYADDPTVYGWELWNEINAVRGGDYMAWTAFMLPELHRLFPKHLCMQSLGSFDTARARDVYRRHTLLARNDVAQVHRYLDLGAQLDACKGPVDVLAVDAVRELLAAKPNKPVMLAESGAVEPSHSAASKLYPQDKAGMLLHDILFAPFFAGAAGSGQCWHWNVYVDKNDLWWHFGRFAQTVKGLDPPAEHFQPATIDHPRLRIYMLRGQKTTLAWCRDKANTWKTELVEKQAPEKILGVSIPLGIAAGIAKIYDPWNDRWSTASIIDGSVALPDFQRSIVVRVEK